MPRTPTIELVEQLNRNSGPYRDPLARIDWSRLDRDSYWLPEEALSLYGLKEFADLPPERRRALSQQEFLHIARVAYWLEGLFMERTTRALSHDHDNAVLTRYRLHELREQAGHALIYHELVKRNSPLTRDIPYDGARLPALLIRHAPLDSPLYRLTALLCAEVPDRLNRFVRQQREAVNPVIGEIVNIQIIDDARHIAQARDAAEASLHGKPRRGWIFVQGLVRQAFLRIVAMFCYPTLQVYERAGLKPGKQWLQAAAANAEHLRFINDCIAPTRRLLAQSGVEL